MSHSNFRLRNNFSRFFTFMSALCLALSINACASKIEPQTDVRTAEQATGETFPQAPNHPSAQVSEQSPAQSGQASAKAPAEAPTKAPATSAHENAQEFSFTVDDVQVRYSTPPGYKQASQSALAARFRTLLSDILPDTVDIADLFIHPSPGDAPDNFIAISYFAQSISKQEFDATKPLLLPLMHKAEQLKKELAQSTPEYTEEIDKLRMGNAPQIIEDTANSITAVINLSVPQEDGQMATIFTSTSFVFLNNKIIYVHQFLPIPDSDMRDTFIKQSLANLHGLRLESAIIPVK